MRELGPEVASVHTDVLDGSNDMLREVMYQVADTERFVLEVQRNRLLKAFIFCLFIN